MATRKLSAETGDRARAHAIGNALQDLIEPPPGALAVFENGPGRWLIEAYFDGDTDAGDIGAALAAVIEGPVPVFRAESVPDLNWVAISQAALPPVAVGRFTIYGTHDQGRVARGPSAILIDAGEAFGTAHHATTFGCLAAIDRLARSGRFRSVLDLGCGSGVLSIVAARAMPGARITAVDIDTQSVRVARENVRLNGEAKRIRLFVAGGLSHSEIRQRGPFDLLIANILAGPLIRLAPQISRSVRRGGTVVLSGILILQAPEVVAAYVAQGFALRRHDRIAGWSTLTLEKR